jgi:hypothetical protein
MTTVDHIDQFPPGLVDHFFARLFDELSSAVGAFEPLLTVVDVTVLNRFSGRTKGAGRHGRRTEDFTSPSLHLEHYP